MASLEARLLMSENAELSMDRNYFPTVYDPIVWSCSVEPLGTIPTATGGITLNFVVFA